MHVYLIRHGSTAGNLQRRYVGVTDEELTEDAVQELRLARTRYPVPDCVFASPMRRCLQTAQLLFPETPAVTLEGLRECDFGDFEYKNYQELQGDARYQAWIDSGGAAAFPGGESRENFADRCCAAFVEGCREALEQRCASAAFVVHGGTIMAVLDRFSDPHRDYFDWQTENGAGFSAELVCEADVSGSLAAESDGVRGEDCRESVYSRFTEIAESDGGSYEGIHFRLTDIKILPESRDAIGIENQYVMKQNKRLRCGYTTGSCAAGAAKAAAEMLLSGRICRFADLTTPRGIVLHLPVQAQKTAEHAAECAIRKYGGDDPDATDGLLIYARAEFAEGVVHAAGTQNKSADGMTENRTENIVSITENQSKNIGVIAEERIENIGCTVDRPQVLIEGGEGVGRVTKPGLEQPVGAAAINRVPREMIAREVSAVCEMYEYTGALRITISVPGGRAAAQKTFNPHIGIEGGISILGTSGIVVPMSEEALIASIRLEMQQKYASGERNLLVTPGNYGADFIRRRELSQALDAERSMKCSNYVGETVDMAAELGFRSILFVAHIGKFIKVSGGIMNTHSAQADCRAELMAAQALRAMRRQAAEHEYGNKLSDAAFQMEVTERLLDANTTEEAVAVLREAGILEITMAEILRRIQFHLQKRCRGAIRTEVVLFSSRFGYLGETDGAEELMERLAQKNVQSS